VTVRSTAYILNCCSVSFDGELEITRRKNSLDTDARPGRLRCLKAAVILAMTASRHMTLKGIMMAADDKPPVSRGFVGRRRAPAQTERVPPGQYVTPDFPILSAGPTPHIPLEEWSFALQYGPDRLGEWNTSRGSAIC
jgi:hypothetical protein